MHQVRLDSGVQQRDPIIYYVCHIYHIYEEYSFQILFHGRSSQDDCRLLPDIEYGSRASKRFLNSVLTQPQVAGYPASAMLKCPYSPHVHGSPLLRGLDSKPIGTAPTVCADLAPAHLPRAAESSSPCSVPGVLCGGRLWAGRMMFLSYLTCAAASSA